MSDVVQSCCGDKPWSLRVREWECCQSPVVGWLFGGEGLNGESPVVVCPRPAALGGGLCSVGNPPGNHCLQSASEERLLCVYLHIVLALPVHGVTEVATFQKTWSSE